MTNSDSKGRSTETSLAVMQSEDSKNSLVVLTVSMAALVLISIGLFWYFGMLPTMHHTLPGQPG